MVSLFSTVGNEFLVNTATNGDQLFQDQVALTNGSFVIVWQDQQSGQGDISGQLFDANGTKLGSQFLVNTSTSGTQGLPSVDDLASGRFIVTWWDNSGQGGDADASIKAQIFNANGTKVGGEFLVNTVTAGMQFDPVVNGLASGNFIVTWRDSSGLGGDVSGTALKGQLFGPTGSKIGSEFLVNTATAGNQGQPEACSLASGGFAIVWEDESGSGGDSNGSAIKVQRFGANGAKLGGELLVNTATYENQIEPNIKPLASGGFVVTWTDASEIGGDDQNWSVKAQIFDSLGNKLGSEILLNTSVQGSQYQSDILALSSGGFVATWVDSSSLGGDTSITSIKAQIFDASGVKVGSEFLVNTNTENQQSFPKISNLGAEKFIISWNDQSLVGDPSGAGIKAQIFSSSSGPTDIAVSDSVIKEGVINNLPVATITTTGTVGTIYSYTLLDDSAGAFEIQGDKLVVVRSGLLDFETSPDVTVTIRSSDEWGNFVDKTLNITITDTTESPHYVALDETVVNTPTTGFQSHPAVATLSSGNLVVVWEDSGNGSSLDLQAQIITPEGTAVGDPFTVHATTPIDESGAKVVALASGGFAVVWEIIGDDISEPALPGVKGQLFDADGHKLGSEFLVNTTIAGRQYEPSIAALPSGGFAVAWTDYPGGIKVQMFDSSGNKVGVESTANSAASEAAKSQPTITILQSGNFVVAWTYGETDSAKAQLFNASGGKVGGEFDVNAPFSHSFEPKLTALANGGFVAIWNDASGNDPAGGLVGQVFNSSGAKVGATFQVNGTTEGSQFEASITALPSGGFVVSWTGSEASSNGNLEIYSQMFDLAGAKVGEEFRVNSPTALLSEEFSALATLSSGGFSIVWRGEDESDSFGIKIRSFEPIIEGTSGLDVLGGTPNADHIRGYAGNDTLSGLQGNDRLDGGTGADAMSGGADDDTYVVDDAGDTVSEEEGEGTDEVETTLGYGAFVLVRLNNAYHLGANVENLTGTGLDQGLWGNGLDNVVTAGVGADLINMQDGGNDTANGGDGRDVIYYGATLTAGDTNDGGDEGGDVRGDLMIIQGDYSLTLGAAQLNDIEVLRTLSGTRTDYHDSGTNSYDYTITLSDAAVAAGTRLVIQGQSLQEGEHLIADASAESDGNLQMFGGKDSDILIGGAQFDHLLGRAGDDMLTGNGGDDRLRGGLGGDTMDGGAGADTFVYAAANGAEVYAAVLESTGLSYDTIIGFNFAEDKIDLPGTVSGLASVTTGALSDASFDADLASAVDASLAANGAVLFDVTSGGHSGQTFLVVDADGNGSYQAEQDFVIQLQTLVGTVPDSSDLFM